MRGARVIMAGGAIVLTVALLGAIGMAAQEKVYQETAAVGTNMNHVPSFVGVEKGIFLKHGVDLKLKVLATGQEMTKAVVAGEARFLGAAFSNFPMAVQQGFKGKGIVGLSGDRTGKYFDEPVGIVTRKGSGIAKVEDLAGKKIGTPTGGMGDEYLGIVLKKAGVPVGRVSILNVPPGTSVSALGGGQVDALAVWEPYLTQALEKIPDAVLVQRGGNHLGYFINMSTLTEVIEREADMVYRYVVGMAEATQYARQHPDEAAEIATRWIPGLDGGLARKAIRYMRYDSRITKHTQESWEESVRVLLEQKKLRAPVTWAQSADLRFIERAQREYPHLFSDLKPVP